MSDSKQKRKITLSLDESTLDMLGKIAKSNAYDNISATIRILVKKYGKLETKENS